MKGSYHNDTLASMEFNRTQNLSMAGWQPLSREYPLCYFHTG
jgi:hypothetical protein